mgnify:CR=1 FL=1
MAHEILSVKLYELDKKISQVHSRIQISESANRDRIRAEIEAIRNECKENELMLRNELQFSKAGTVSKLAEAYAEVEQIIQKVKERIGRSSSKWGDELSVEEKILFAEYALDFAMQVANHALLISLEAIDAQMAQQEKQL